MRQGFTLIELMIVVAIIAVVAAIAIPNLLESRKQANESNAIASLRTYGAAQYIYHKSNYSNCNGLPAKHYCPWFSRLGGPNAHTAVAGTRLTLLCKEFALATGAPGAPAFQGYVFTDDQTLAVPADWGGTFGLYADPALYGTTGIASLYMDARGVVRMKDLAGAGSQGNAVVDATWLSP